MLAPSKISWGGFYKTRRGISSPFLLLRKRKDVNVKYFLRNHFFLITTHYRHHHHNHIYIHTFLGADSFFFPFPSIRWICKECEGIPFLCVMLCFADMITKKKLPTIFLHPLVTRTDWKEKSSFCMFVFLAEFFYTEK